MTQAVIDLNARVEVRLTKEGAKVYNELYKGTSIKPVQPRYRYRTELWFLMKTFARHFIHNHNLFEGNRIKVL